MDENFSFQALYNFIHRMLIATEETKRTLEVECEEAKFALKPWLIESTIIKQLDKNTCSCEEEILEKSEEIAEEIGKAVLHSQQLREKLAANLHKERKESRKPDLKQIYVPRGPPLKESNANVKQREKNPRRSVSQPRQTDQQRPTKIRSASSVRFVDENIPGKRSRMMAKMNLRPSRDNSLAKLTTAPRNKTNQTNFILANKLSVRSSKSADTERRPKCLLEASRKTPIEPKNAKPVKSSEKLNHVRGDDLEAMNELNNLIKRFTTSTTLSSTEAKNNCPIHAPNAPGFVEEKIVTSVDAVEGLDRVGLPSPLVHILKIYHAYVKAEVLQEPPVILKKHQDCVTNFMTNFETLNDKKSLPILHKYQELLSGFSELYKDSYNLNFSKTQRKKLITNFIALGSIFDEYQIKAKAGELTLIKSNEVYEEYRPDMKNWISNGIWNFLCIPNMKGIFGSHCIQYSERNQLVLFYDFIQKIQRKVYEIELIELLMMTLIPQLKEMVDPRSSEFIDTYKMIVTIVQILNPTVPVLARTDPND